MGFFSSLMGGGGSSTSTTGDIMFTKANKNLASVARNYLPMNTSWNPNQKQEVIDMFTPMAQTSDETTAFDRMRQGFAPTQESLNADVNMLMNPYDTHVIDEINRQAQGQNSILQQNMTNAGQLGSNRQMFGAGDIETNRLRTVGLFKQDQYNTALDRALGQLTDLRMNDTQNLLGIGEFQRNLDMQRKLAPVSAIQAMTPVIQGLPQYSSTTTKQGGGGLFNTAMQLGGALLSPGPVIPAGATVGPSALERIFSWR